MFYEVDLLNVYSSSFIAIMLLVVLFICNFWRFKYKVYENKILMLMIVVSALSSLILVISYVVDGKPGALFTFLGHISNSYIFCANMVTAFLWMLLIEAHLKYEPSTRKKALLAIPMAVGLLLMVINLFTPCVYKLDENNVYSRVSLYYVLFGIDLFYIVYAVAICIFTKTKGGILKFFPVYLYIGPILLGLIAETLVPGISVSWPCQAIAIAGVLASMQNETIYRDPLTGLYNRSYLNYLQKNMLSKDHCHITGIMLDMDDFKVINDQYGHAVGDLALQQMARVLKEAVGDMGNVIRYAGDEFIVLINSHKQVVVDACLEEIDRCIKKFNDSQITEYKLSASKGYAMYMPKSQSVDDFMNIIDQKMYEDKKRYHNMD